MNTPTVRELMNFILANRGDKVFRNMTEGEILVLLRDSLEEDGLVFSLDASGKINGCLVSIPNHNTKRLFVFENLAMNLSTLKQFYKIKQRLYPEYTIDAMRHGKLRSFNTARLTNKLT